jgi:hypothetical protein
MLIAIPLSSVFGGILMIYLAVTHPADLVKDSYYKEGMGINKRSARDLAPLELGIEADVVFREDIGDVEVLLRGVEETALIMELIHPSSKERDMITGLLKHPDDPFRYEGHFLEPLSGRWYIELRDTDNQWRMRGRIIFPVQGVLEMRPSS